ncbi:LysR family transcriptional regulator [Aquabacter spiritensis]|uniref:DNA-binding transcriptional LysR family regulator n=1 Tax=Aquabacter spiritensis TaxID=933073 RepID=A0A4R3LZB8_9HYPH|nr:LysR family transcriptional regulator [Aquabacter spiritensis]TCT05239.1 DNA-binding transcriptional LysR family regulator [Aquabacter spiritensis]
MTATDFEWSDLRFFLAVARAGKLTLAARQLGVEHSTVGRRIGALERMLGAKLFDRQPGGYVLTAPGERLLVSAEAMETLASAARQEIGGADLGAAGTVRIGAPDGFGTFFLAPRMGRLAAQHPALEVQFLAMPRLFNLTKREADIAISLSRPNQGRLHAKKLTDYRLGLYAAPSYLAAHGPVENRATLARHTFISYVDELLYAPELDYLPLVSKDLRPRVKSSSLVAQFMAARAGAGLAILPCFMADAEPGLAPVLAGEVELTRTFWLITHADTRTLARVRVAADFIAQEAQEARSVLLPAR